MAAQRVADLTMQELRALIQDMIDQQFKTRPWPQSPPDRSPAEIFESMRKNLIRPQPGEPSAVEMILEDRRRWD